MHVACVLASSADAAVLLLSAAGSTRCGCLHCSLAVRFRCGLRSCDGAPALLQRLTCACPFASVDRPLDPDTGAALRQLCRRLCALRAACSGSGVAPGSPDAEAVPRINLLLAAAGEYHGAARGLYAQ